MYGYCTECVYLLLKYTYKHILTLVLTYLNIEKSSWMYSCRSLLYTFPLIHKPGSGSKLGSSHPDHPGHALSRSSGSDPVYKLSGSNPASALDE